MLKSEEVRQGNQHKGTVQKNEQQAEKEMNVRKTTGLMWMEEILDRKKPREKEVAKGSGFHSEKKNEWNTLGRSTETTGREKTNKNTGMRYEGKKG